MVELEGEVPESFRSGPDAQMATNGKMLWFNAKKGFGLICTEDDVRLDVAESSFLPGDVPEGRCAGREVFFDVFIRGDERRAMNVRFSPVVDARRARRRQANRR